MREMKKEQANQELSFGPYRLDSERVQLWRGVQEVRLTGKAFAVLRYFVEHPGQLVTKDELFQAVWPQTVVTESTLASCIQELRQALRDDAKKPRYIETVHRRGYRWIAAIAPQANEPVFHFETTADPPSPLPPLSSPPIPGEGHTARLSPFSPSPEAEEEKEENSSPAVHSLFSIPPAPTRSRLSRSLIWIGVLVLVGVSVTVFYLASLHIPYFALRTQEMLPLPEKPSLAVMPFTNLSGDPEQEYFSDGLTDDLITDLSRLSGLFVIARHSVFTYKGKAVKVQDVSKELGVRYVLEGSVRKSDGKVRINAQLVDATTGHHLWAERYERLLTDIFALQDEIVQKIVTTLKLQVTLWEQGILVRKRTDNVDAYDYNLRGLESFFRFTKEGCIQAQQLFAQAIELDPQYADAYANLGGMYQMAGFFQWSQDPHRDLERALALAQQAVTLDDSLPLAHEVLSIVYLMKKQYEQARIEAERMITLAPTSPRGYRTLGSILNLTGQAEQAIGMLEQTLRLDPRYPLPYQGPLGWAYLMTRRYDKAIATQQKALSHNRNLLESHLILTISYSELGREAEARAEAAEVLRLSPTYSLDVVRQTWPYKDPADLERTLAALRKAGLK